MTDIQNKIAKQNKQFRLQCMDDEFLLYNPLQTKAIYLNATATLIWRLCDEQLSIEQMIDVLMQQYPQSGEKFALTF